MAEANSELLIKPRNDNRRNKNGNQRGKQNIAIGTDRDGQAVHLAIEPEQQQYSDHGEYFLEHRMDPLDLFTARLMPIRRMATAKALQSGALRPSLDTFALQTERKNYSAEQCYFRQ
jgi:hypothetical protein